jgi:hypothetical protein
MAQMTISTKPTRSPLMEKLEDFVDQSIDKMSKSELRRFEKKAEKLMKQSAKRRRAASANARRETP